MVRGFCILSLYLILFLLDPFKFYVSLLFIGCLCVCICCNYFDVSLFQFKSQTAGALSLPHFNPQHLAQCLAKLWIKNIYWRHDKWMPKRVQSCSPKGQSKPEHHKLYLFHIFDPHYRKDSGTFKFWDILLYITPSGRDITHK